MDDMDNLIEEWLDYVVDGIPSDVPGLPAINPSEHFETYLNMTIWDGRNVPQIIADGDTETLAQVIRALGS